jgi:pimeloyl-ACP methyl ester carboxylesterase
VPVLADGQLIAVRAVGTGPDVLCVPGGPARAVAYLGDLGGLDRTRTLHLLDTRGSGGSHPAEPQTLTLDRLARDLIEVLPLLGLEHPVLLAHSFGTRVAVTALAMEPALASAVILVTPPLVLEGYLEGRAAILDARAGDPAYADAVEAARALPDARPRDRAFLERESRPLWYGTWDDAAKAHAERGASQVNVRTALTLRNDTAGWTPPALDLDVPVLVVGGQLDLAVPPLCARAAAAAIPGATYAEIEGAGHYPWLDDPEAFTALVADVQGGHALT